MGRKEIIEHVKKVTNFTVQSGPFAGLRFYDSQTWGNGEDIGSQLLGSYEQELHSTLRRFILKQPSTVLNVGCAEGYYTVGTARLLASATVHAFDIDSRAREVCHANAMLNGVSERVIVREYCSVADIVQISESDTNVLAIIDCEGYERDLFLSTDCITSLKYANMIVETHDVDNVNTIVDLFAKIFSSHRVSIIYASGRNPHEFPILDNFSDLEKWLVICENRPRLQAWLACESRAAALPASINLAGW